jgi:hypothetical protein
LVRGLPPIRQVSEICESCKAGKQRHSSFLDQAKWRAECSFELVHGDLCGPIASMTPSVNAYFLLLVDDKSQFMWPLLLETKDQEMVVIKEYHAHAEGESNCKLTVHTQCGGEFNSKEFIEYCASYGLWR